ncbi:unnamed protein product [Caenorhabditis auriculariae]|uniref:Uncharacterized protein n=1 Tax=Caenorhabditis auriculariae TaxID=2777116 RepID=A0A8S1GUQ3_9PELO|nr:unnamed protein product [Caenorhabditis auriculariae]
MGSIDIFSDEIPTFYIATVYLIAVLGMSTSSFSMHLVKNKLSNTPYRYYLLTYMLNSSVAEMFTIFCILPKPLFPIVGAKVWSPVVNNFGLNKYLATSTLRHSLCHNSKKQFKNTIQKAANMSLDNVYFYEYKTNDMILYSVFFGYGFELAGVFFLAFCPQEPYPYNEMSFKA